MRNDWSSAWLGALVSKAALLAPAIVPAKTDLANLHMGKSSLTHTDCARSAFGRWLPVRFGSSGGGKQTLRFL